MIVIDTHVLIWLTEGHERIGKKTRRLADEALKDDSLCVSAISFWEVEMLSQKGKICLSQPTRTWRLELLGLGLLEIPISGEIGIEAAAIENFHGDPADRIITATALHHGATIITADEQIIKWPGRLKLQDARK